MARHLILILFTLLVAPKATSQSIQNGLEHIDAVAPHIVFENLTEKDGLSYNFATDIMQDKDGLIWISTLSGLNRYDGKRFKVFKKNKNLNSSLQFNHINKLCQDQNGDVWGCSNDGIFFYSKKPNSFRHYFIQDSFKYPNTPVIACDPKGQIWAGSDFGLVKLNKETGRFEYLGFNEKDENSISHNYIRKDGIVVDPSGNGLWIATPRGLNYYDFNKGNFINYRNKLNSNLFNDHHIGPLYVSKQGLIWMLDDQTDELIAFKNFEGNVLHRISLKGKINDAYAGTIFETSHHHLWYSSQSYETVRIEYLKNNRYEKIVNDVSNPNSISGDLILSAWEDKDHTVWFATSGGISKYNYEKLFYKIYKLTELYPELNNNWQITCLTQNHEDGSWWLGSRNGLIYSYHDITNKSKRIDLTSMDKSIGKFITDIDFVDGIAIICYAGGPTYQYDPRKNMLQKFTSLAGKYEQYKTRTLSQETDSTYLLSNNYLPILRWHKKSDVIEEIYFKNEKNWQGNQLTAGWLKASKGNGSWMAASNDMLGYIHPGSSEIQTIQLEIGMKVLKGGYFNALETDDEGNVWFSYTGHGLYYGVKELDSKHKIVNFKLHHWDSSDGLINEHIQSAVPDRSGKIWCGAYHKYSVFDANTNNFFNFQINLSQSNSFYYNYMIPLKNGNVLTNIMGNLVEFYPDKMKSSYPNNEPIISFLQLPAKTIFFTKDTFLTLEPNENFITIGFGCLSNQETYNYHFEYKLEGVNESWVVADQNAESTYSDLSPGIYVFKLRAISEDKKWSSKVKNITIKIKAPFYKTSWFFILVLSMLSLISYILIRNRIRNSKNLVELKSKAQLLEKEKTAVMYENLKQHLNPHFLFNSLTSLSSLIRLDQKQAGDFLDKMSKVYRYILKNKDNETVTLEEELKFVDMYIQLQKTRFAESLQISIDIPSEALYRKIAPVTLQNLVENSIKHNIADEDSPLVIRFYIEDDYLVIRNNLQRKNFVETSNKQGQMSMISLYRYLSNRPVLIEETEQYYTVKIPLL